MATPVMVSSEKVMSAVNSADVLIPAADTSANLVDGLNLYPTDTREPIDHLLLESIVKELNFSPFRAISWHEVASAISMLAGVPVDTWSVKARFNELNLLHCMIRTLCQSNEFQWDSSKCEIQASDLMWQEIISRRPSFAVIRGLHFPMFEGLSTIDRIRESEPLRSSVRLGASEEIGLRQKRMSCSSRSNKPRPNKSVEEGKYTSITSSSPKSCKDEKGAQKKKTKRGRPRSSDIQVKKEDVCVSWTPDNDRLLIEQAVLQFQTGDWSSAWKAVVEDWNGSFRIRGKPEVLYERYHTLCNAYRVILQLEKVPGLRWDPNSCTLSCSTQADFGIITNEFSLQNKLSDALEWILQELNRNSSFVFPLFYEIQNLNNLISRSSRKRRQSLDDCKDSKFRRLSSDVDVKGSRDSWTAASEVYFAEELCKYRNKDSEDHASIKWLNLIEQLSNKFRISFSETFLRQKFAFLHRKYRQWRKIIRFKEVTWDPEECRIIAPGHFWEKLRQDKSHFKLYCLFRYFKFPSARYLDRFLSSSTGESDAETLSISNLQESSSNQT